MSLFKTFAKVRNHQENIRKIKEKISPDQIFRIKISKEETGRLARL